MRRATTMKLRTILLAALATPLLAGCISIGGGGKPPKALMSLTPAAHAPAGAGVSAPLASGLLVTEPDTDRVLALPRVPVQVDDTHLAYLKDAQWVERPARLFRALLAETIRAQGKRLVFEETEPLARDVLGGKLLAMGYDARTRAVTVRYDAMRERPGQPVATRRFEASVAGVPAQADAVAAALNQAANKVAADVADWVS
ncbi:MAG: membrane integrity-associated transporter subunit PqiC [Sphingomonadales bacterium]|nr:membrane integrity-associated transporter subunit PqiC [Sphingomonadales bacterium]